MSGHSVSVGSREDHSADGGIGPVGRNGHRQRAPEEIAEIAIWFNRVTATAGQNEPARPCREQLGCRDASAHPRRGNAEFSRPAAAVNGFAEFGHDRLGWTQRQRRRRSRRASSSARHQAARPGHRGPARSPDRPARNTVGGTEPQAGLTECAGGLGQDDCAGAVGPGRRRGRRLWLAVA